MSMTETELETLRSAADQMPGRAGELLRMALDHADRLQYKLTAAYAANQNSFDAGEARARKWYESKLAAMQPSADARQTASIVSGVVLRDGMPTLISDKYIQPSDVRLCIASGHVRDDTEMIEPSSLPKPQPFMWMKEDGDTTTFVRHQPDASCPASMFVGWTPLYESVMPGCYWCDQTVKMGDAYHKGLEDGRARAMKLVADQRGDALLVPRDVLLNLLDGSESHDCTSGAGECPVCLAEAAAADLLAVGGE